MIILYLSQKTPTNKQTNTTLQYGDHSYNSISDFVIISVTLNN